MLYKNYLLFKCLWNSLRRNGSATIAFQPGWRGIDSRETDALLTSKCGPQHISPCKPDCICLKTKLRGKCTVHLSQQGDRAKKTGWDISLGWWSASDTKSSVGLWGTPRFYCCGGMLQCQIKTAQTLRRPSVSLHSLNYRQTYWCIREN